MPPDFHPDGPRPGDSAYRSGLCGHALPAARTLKALIVILALVGLSFVGLLVYGSQPDGPPKRDCERVPPPPEGKTEPEADAMEDWCPPSFAERTKPLQARFGPGLGQGKREIEVGKIARSLPVAAADDSDDVRAAKLLLLEGKFVFAGGGLEDAVVCLCSEGAPIPGDLREKCDSAWRNKHANKALCEKGSERGTMPFDGSSGAIAFPANEQKARALVQVE